MSGVDCEGMIWRDGWMQGWMEEWRGLGCMADVLELRQTFLGTLPHQGETEGKTGGAASREDEPCLQWGDLAGLPLLCLSGSGSAAPEEIKKTSSRFVGAAGWALSSAANPSSDRKTRKRKTLGWRKSWRLKGQRETNHIIKTFFCKRK